MDENGEARVSNWTLLRSISELSERLARQEERHEAAGVSYREERTRQSAGIDNCLGEVVKLREEIQRELKWIKDELNRQADILAPMVRQESKRLTRREGVFISMIGAAFSLAVAVTLLILTHYAGLH